MGVQVRFSPGHDIYYLPGRARPGGGGERTAGGYYVNAALAGEPPGRWFGKGAAALGLDEGDEVDPAVHEKVFSQVDPRTRGRIRRGPARDTAEKRAAREAELGRLLAAEPHATAARRHELERQAAQSGGMRPKDLGTLDSSRGGLTIPRRVKAVPRLPIGPHTIGCGRPD